MTENRGSSLDSGKQDSLFPKPATQQTRVQIPAAAPTHLHHITDRFSHRSKKASPFQAVTPINRRPILYLYRTCTELEPALEHRGDAREPHGGRRLHQGILERNRHGNARESCSRHYYRLILALTLFLSLSVKNFKFI